MDKESLIEKIVELATPLLKESEVDLIDLTVKRTKGLTTVQMLADKPRGGITLEECSQLNKKIGSILERENLIDERYVLEVCSPGLDRPLKTPKDFLRVIGWEVRIFLIMPFADKMEYAGIVKSIDDEKLKIKVDEREMSIPFEMIHRGKQII